MALATNSTQGSIVLSGDLTGVAGAVELRPTGVVAGSYVKANIVVDAKGRLIYAADSTSTQICALVPNGTSTTGGLIQACDQLIVADDVLSLNMQDATTAVKGQIQAGTGTQVLNGLFELNFATTYSKGIMQVGTGLSAPNGVLTLDPIAVGYGTSKGVVQIQSGGGINVTNGVISYAYGNATSTNKGVASYGQYLDVTNGHVAANVPDASNAVKGYASVGSNINLVGNTISVNTATTSVKGVVQAGSGLDSINGSLTFTAGTTAAAGIVSVTPHGGIDVTNGVISYATATTADLGIVSVGSNINLVSNTISVNTATNAVKGVASYGTGLSTSSGVVSLNAPDGSSTTKGIVQVGSRLNISSAAISVGTNVLRTNVAQNLPYRQTHSIASGTTWSGADANIFTLASGATAINNGTNVVPGSYYHFIITNSSSMTYDTQFKFKSGATTQPFGTTSILSCYAVDSNTLYCIMQPNFA